ncbi:MAG: hypothetical protein CMJ48_07460 [Planctomycetaceae bacterium]|nr:hypothetical protein [Planctomycetaceae bacterium]
MKRIASQPDERRRPGFTLIELLIVIGLIGFMAAMGVILVQTMAGNAKEARTKVIIEQIDKQIAQRLDGFDRWFDSQEKFLLQKLRIYSVTEKNRILGKKTYFKAYFPQTPGEVLKSENIYSYWWDEDGARKDTVDDAADSAEVLYYMLMEMPVFGTESVNEGNFDNTMIGDTDDDGLKEFIDGWGNPIRFYRWPTRLVKPDGTINRDIATLLISALPPGKPGAGAGAQLDIDPDDPTAALKIADIDEDDFHTYNTWHTPIIVSAGGDGKLGLYEPTDTSSTKGRLARPKYADETAGSAEETKLIEQLYDNISNANVTAE